MKQLLIFGAGGNGREVLQVVNAINSVKRQWLIGGFLVEQKYYDTPEVQGYPVHKLEKWRPNGTITYIFNSIGSSHLRKQCNTRIKSLFDIRFATLVHPRAWIGDNVNIGEGVIICSGSQITTDIAIEDHVHINTSCTVAHDTVLSDYVTLSPGVNIAGGAKLNTGVEAGIGSVVLPRVSIGAWSILGAGGVATRDLPENSVCVGAPAKVIKKRVEDWHLL